MYSLNNDEVDSLIAGQLSDKLYHKVFEHLCNTGEMPYGIQKARTGDPYDFVFNYLVNQINNGK